MVDQPTPGVPVYAVKSIAGGRPRVLHRNLLLPLQGRVRQEGGVGEEGCSDSEEEEEEMRCLSWLGLHVGDLGGPPDLRQAPLSKGILTSC